MLKYVNGITLEITQRCNSQCQYCFSESTPHTVNEIPMMNIIDLLEQFYKLENKIAYDKCENKKLKTQVVITGGEFLLHSEWKTLLRVFSENDWVFDAATNGIALDEEAIACIANSSVHDLQISLDGLNDSDNILRNPAQTKNVIKQIILASKSPLKDKLTIKSTLTKANIMAAPDLIQFCAELGVRLVFGYVQILGRATKHLDYALNTDEIVKFNIDIVENYPDLVLPLMFSHTPCPLDIEEEPLSFRIAANGDIFPCASFHENFFCLGNIFEMTLEEAINSIKFHEIQKWVSERKQHMALTSCHNCYVCNLCQGSCPAASYYEHDDVNVPTSRLCNAAKKFNYYMLPKLLKNKVTFVER